MKKLLLLLLLSLGLIGCSSTSNLASPSPQEDLSKVNIDNLKRLSGSEIINTFTNTQELGYMSSGTRFSEYNYASGDFTYDSVNYMSSGKWKVFENQMCWKATTKFGEFPEKMFSCASIYTDFNEGEYYFYIPGIGVYGKTTAIIPLID